MKLHFFSWKYYLPEDWGGAGEMYSARTSPLQISLPGIFITSQCNNSLKVGSFRLGASGSIKKK